MAVKKATMPYYRHITLLSICTVRKSYNYCKGYSKICAQPKLKNDCPPKPKQKERRSSLTDQGQRTSIKIRWQSLSARRIVPSSPKLPHPQTYPSPSEPDACVSFCEPRPPSNTQIVAIAFTQILFGVVGVQRSRVLWLER